MTEQHEAGAVSAKTINNARAALSSALADAVRNDLLPRNPCQFVAPLPIERSELDYLRPRSTHTSTPAPPIIDRWPNCSSAPAPASPKPWRSPGTISTSTTDSSTSAASAPRRGTSSRPTKGKRQRSILIGPRLTTTLTTLRPGTAGPTDWLFICPRPTRGRYANRPATDPPHCKTVHDWHERALAEAGIRDLPLHALRHTAAATWLSTGHSLLFVARQLGHRSITHTDDAIRAATPHP